MAATTTERPKAGPAALMLWSLAAFLLLLAVLAVQVRAGGDPALGPAQPAAKAARRVIVHRVILRRVVVSERAPAEAEPSGGSSVAAAPAGGSRGSAAPAPASAPPPAAPAPAPAPVATGSS